MRNPRMGQGPCVEILGSPGPRPGDDRGFRETQHLERITVLLDSRMFDLDQPVTVQVGDEMLSGERGALQHSADREEIDASRSSTLFSISLVTHKTPAVKKWLSAHPRFAPRFTPIGGSWLNLIEHWFASLTGKALRRAVHTSVKDLSADIKAYITAVNDSPKPYRWTKTADEILASIAKACTRTLAAHST